VDLLQRQCCLPRTSPATRLLSLIRRFRILDDEKLKHNEEGDGDLRCKPSLCLGILSFSPCIIEPAEEPNYPSRITNELKALAISLLVIFDFRSKRRFYALLDFDVLTVDTGSSKDAK
jgi:hypothetical protein